MLTQERLKELLHYSPDMGVFTWLVSQGAVSAGTVAGSINKVNRYLYISIDKKKYKAHRLAWLYVYGEFPKNEIDHINHDRSDNRVSKLRVVTHQENGKNKSKHCNNTSGHTGVQTYKSYTKGTRYKAVLYHKDKKVLSKVFDTMEKAISARKAAEAEYGFHNNHGE